MPEIPKCEKCGSEMELKTAKKGKNAGSQFWGCPNWRTTCRGITIDYKPEGSNSASGAVKPSASIVSPELPQMLSARSRRKGMQVRFFDSLAIPKGLLDLIYEGEVSESKIKSFRRWRMDYPIRGDFVFDEEDKEVALMVNKLLLRGSVIYNSRHAEELLREHFLSHEVVDWALLSEEDVFRDVLGSSVVNSYETFDSVEEKIFYEHLWPKFFWSIVL